MIYDIEGHVLLSEGAAQLGAAELEAHARVAETLLGFLKYSPYTLDNNADFYNRAADAVALQVSFQVESGIEAFVLSASRRGSRTKTYRGGHRRHPTVHSLAKKIAQSIKPSSTVTTGR